MGFRKHPDPSYKQYPWLQTTFKGYKASKLSFWNSSLKSCTLHHQQWTCATYKHIIHVPIIHVIVITLWNKKYEEHFMRDTMGNQLHKLNT